jgi:hypothetical protein
MFLLYTVDKEGNYKLISPIKKDKNDKAHSNVHLAGKGNSPLRSYVINNKDKTKKVKKLNNGCLIWEMNEEALIEEFRELGWAKGLGEDKGAFFVDLKPDKTEVSLYRVVGVYGYTYESWWTVVMIKMKPYFIDFDPSKSGIKPEELKNGFDNNYLEKHKENRLKGKDGLPKKGFVFDFLYFTYPNGVEDEWEPPPWARYNAALLFEGKNEALNYFVSILERELRE